MHTLKCRHKANSHILGWLNPRTGFPSHHVCLPLKQVIIFNQAKSFKLEKVTMESKFPSHPFPWFPFLSPSVSVVSSFLCVFHHGYPSKDISVVLYAYYIHNFFEIAFQKYFKKSLLIPITLVWVSSKAETEARTQQQAGYQRAVYY